MKRLLQKVSLAIVVMAFICLGAVEQSFGSSYTITDLGTLGNTPSWANDINSQGDVVGQSNTTATAYHAFYYHNGFMYDIGSICGLGGTSNVAWGINNAGSVVGDSYLSGDVYIHAFLCGGESSSPKDLGTLGGTDSWALRNQQCRLGSGHVVLQSPEFTHPRISIQRRSDDRPRDPWRNTKFCSRNQRCRLGSGGSTDYRGHSNSCFSLQGRKYV